MEWQREPILGKQEQYEIGYNIFLQRKKKGWTQEDLASYMGSDHRVVSRHENGSGMDLETLLHYSQVFDCSPLVLLPHKFRVFGLSNSLEETMAILITLPAPKQVIVADMIKAALKLGE